jgi:NDP-sugar pyrophosphorylase family protein
MYSLDQISPESRTGTPVMVEAGVVTQAVIMAGGKGTRLHPYSALFPKPLMPLGDMPVLELLLRRMRRAGVTDVILAINHLGKLIKTFFGDGSQLGLSIRYCHEDRPLGTAGALGNMLEMLDDTFIVSNGDLLTTMDLLAMTQQHVATGCDASIGVFQRENKIDFGLIEFDAEKRLSAYREKPTSLYYVSMGIYVLRREAVRTCVVPGEHLDMPSLLLKMRENDGDIRCYHDDCMWLDIGRPDDFALAQSMFERNREVFLGE